jgi:hypothetical protein
MYYGDMVMDNDEKRLRLERASQRAVRGWRFSYITERSANGRQVYCEQEI